MKRLIILTTIIMILLGSASTVFGAVKTTIKYNANGGKGTMKETSVNTGSSVRLKANSFTRSGYTFKGWAVSKKGKVRYKNKASVKAGKSLDLYAVWKENQYTVKYYANGGTGKMKSSLAAYGKALRLRSCAFTRKGYQFHSWATSPGGDAAYKNGQTVKNLTAKQGGVVRLYARWTPNTYAVRFEANGGKGSMEHASLTYDLEHRLPENSYIRSGYIFQGWNTRADGSGTSYKDKAAVKNLSDRQQGKAALYAQWRGLSRDEAAVQAAKDLATHLYNENNFSKLAGCTFTWDTEKKPYTWSYYNGILMHSLMKLDKEKYQDYVIRYYNDNLKEDGSPIKAVNGELDNIAAGLGLFDILSTKNKTKYQKAIQHLYTELEKQLCFADCGNNFTHKQNADQSPKKNWSVYRIGLDGLYMGTVFILHCADAIDGGRLTLKDKNGNTVTSRELYELSFERLSWVGHNMVDKNTGLLHHGWDPVNGKGNGHFWTRGSGWYAAALTEAMDMIPYASLVSELETIAEEIFSNMTRYLDNGMWRNVTNRGSELSGNRLETSGSAFFAYSMIRSAKGKHISSKYYTVGKNVYFTIINEKLNETELKDILVSSGVHENDASYMLCGYKSNEAKGIAPLFFAAAELDG